MSYRKEDHPPRVAKCRFCGKRFEPEFAYGDVCAPCYHELNDEYPEEEDEDEED